MLRSLLLALLSVFVIGGSWMHGRETENRKSELNQLMRQSIVIQQDAEQRLHRLDSGFSHPLLGVLGEDVTDLQIRLSETLAEWKSSGDRLITAYEQALLPHSTLISDVYDIASKQMLDISILRLNVQAIMKHAPELLDFLNDLQKATGGWPSEVRACDIQRVPSNTLNVQCVVDIYYWHADLSE